MIATYSNNQTLSEHTIKIEEDTIFIDFQDSINIKDSSSGPPQYTMILDDEDEDVL